MTIVPKREEIPTWQQALEERDRDRELLEPGMVTNCNNVYLGMTWDGKYMTLDEDGVVQKDRHKPAPMRAEELPEYWQWNADWLNPTVLPPLPEPPKPAKPLGPGDWITFEPHTGISPDIIYWQFSPGMIALLWAWAPESNYKLVVGTYVADFVRKNAVRSAVPTWGNELLDMLESAVGPAETNIRNTFAGTDTVYSQPGHYGL